MQDARFTALCGAQSTPPAAKCKRGVQEHRIECTHSTHLAAGGGRAELSMPVMACSTARVRPSSGPATAENAACACVHAHQRISAAHSLASHCAHPAQSSDGALNVARGQQERALQVECLGILARRLAWETTAHQRHRDVSRTDAPWSCRCICSTRLLRQNNSSAVRAHRHTHHHTHHHTHTHHPGTCVAKGGDGCARLR